ncbi:MAG: hypothetical protein KJ941_08790 [Bacteroidetes bacterium]|nr:hypothetical protein [Bacteroidota bacterium]
MNAQTLVKVKYSGKLDETGAYTTIGMQTILVLFAGIALWRASNYIFSRKLKERSEKKNFETRYSSQWKNR